MRIYEVKARTGDWHKTSKQFSTIRAAKKCVKVFQRERYSNIEIEVLKKKKEA